VNDVLRRSAAHVLVDDLASPELDDAAAHHVFRVLRVADGDAITVTDGAGAWRSCRAVGSAVEPVGEICRVERDAPAVELFVAVPKQDRPEWLVQKSTELGVDRIVFLHADRSVVRWADERARRHVAKLTRVAEEAAMQSRRVWVPVVEGPVPAHEVVRSGVAVAEPGGRAFAPGDHAVAIGPEGGWSDRELALAGERIGLADTILRVETAAVAACTLLNQLRRSR
jgi:16S rRNA (uracil1498-N3)-methyltransferase